MRLWKFDIRAAGGMNLGAVEVATMFGCRRHGSEAGTRCNVRTVACAYRMALSVACDRCGAKPGAPCINLSPRRSKWQTWEPEPHEGRRPHRD